MSVLDGCFHYKDGWYFTRQDDRSVRIFHVEGESCEVLNDGTHVHSVDCDVTLDIDPDSWASIVASVCGRGEDAGTFQRALNFHDFGRCEPPTAI